MCHCGDKYTCKQNFTGFYTDVAVQILDKFNNINFLCWSNVTTSYHVPISMVEKKQCRDTECGIKWFDVPSFEIKLVLGM